MSIVCLFIPWSLKGDVVVEINISIGGIIFYSAFSITDFLTDLRDECARSDLEGAVYAITGSYGMFRKQMCVDTMVQAIERGCTGDLMLVSY